MSPVLVVTVFDLTRIVLIVQLRLEHRADIGPVSQQVSVSEHPRREHGPSCGQHTSQRRLQHEVTAVHCDCSRCRCAAVRGSGGDLSSGGQLLASCPRDGKRLLEC